MVSTLDFGDITVSNPSCWGDITHEVGGDEAPLTLAKPEGVGALQISLALYKRGESPNPTGDDLLKMTFEFGTSRGLGESFDIDSSDSRLYLGAASYRSEGDFIRVWYLSDGRNIALITYVCSLESEDNAELAECEFIVRSLQFS